MRPAQHQASRLVQQGDSGQPHGALWAHSTTDQSAFFLACRQYLPRRAPKRSRSPPVDSGKSPQRSNSHFQRIIILVSPGTRDHLYYSPAGVGLQVVIYEVENADERPMTVAWTSPRFAPECALQRPYLPRGRRWNRSRLWWGKRAWHSHTSNRIQRLATGEMQVLT